MISIFYRAKAKLLFYFSKERKELNRLKNISRYEPGSTKIFGHNFLFADSASFLGQYKEIFKREIYRFKSVNNAAPYIVDCGANVGVSVLYFKRKYPNAKITAFEPDREIFSILKKNIGTNDERITLINKAVWNQKTKMSFVNEGADGGSILESETAIQNNLKIVEIETVRLRQYLERKVDFLKIDVEGAESAIIEDCKDLLPNIENIFIEFHSAIDKTQQLDSILSNLTNSGFRYYIETSTIFNEKPFMKKKSLNNYDNLLNIYACKTSALL